VQLVGDLYTPACSLLLLTRGAHVSASRQLFGPRISRILRPNPLSTASMLQLVSRNMQSFLDVRLHIRTVLMQIAGEKTKAVIGPSLGGGKLEKIN
jgi:hypothetical protein